ncbi:hypothetical protein KAFR_0K02530 [Kazachstania africana CBS 2517]|uniref:Trafficking protein particle complex subunit n=1 Tax=Kazachstania africana (strain ATCC 22294 / BCRC 22015 / CBS 2517 / CECT 1963 / NBRC 1671 / NRRL Y-8276) TaxID=1071382 RepID=H2B1V9_KAZAF|nr:hypothetical protein KAFR_0K02530 [Kazachstania africana CBS 2517]CCF60609.1 hypothetical protein KAFR_0K02530 [Kazachstania africana CBS 2517]
MSTDNIIYPSTSDDSFKRPNHGYDYTKGAKSHTTIESSSINYPTKIYNDSLVANRKEVSLSSMAFLFQQMIIHFHKDSKTVHEFEEKLLTNGFQIGSKLLELLNFRSSINPTNSSRTSTFLSSNTNLPTPKMQSQTSYDTTSGNSSIPSNNAVISKTTTQNTISNQEAASTSHYSSIANTINKMKRRDLKILDILQFIHGTLWSYLFNHVSDDLVKSSERNNEYMIIDNNPVLTQFINNNIKNSCNYFMCGIINGFLNNAAFICKVTPHRMPTENSDERIVYLIKFDSQVLERENLRFSS